MKVIFFLRFVFVCTVCFGLGVVACVYDPELPVKVGEAIGRDTKPKALPPPVPSVAELNQVLDNSLALVEAQHTYYVHITRNKKFATSIRELGPRTDKNGAVMAMDVWNASDAVSQAAPIHGYLFKILPVTIAAGQQPGFAIVAYPKVQENPWPLFLSVIPDAKGGMISMAASDTWEINDPAAGKSLRALFQRSDLTLQDLDKFSPDKSPTSVLISNFKKDASSTPPGPSADHPADPGQPGKL